MTCLIVIQLKAEIMKALKLIDRCFGDAHFEVNLLIISVSSTLLIRVKDLHLWGVWMCVLKVIIMIRRIKVNKFLSLMYNQFSFNISLMLIHI